MKDVNAVYTLECAHRRQLLAARAKRTIPVDLGPLSRAQRRLGMKTLTILSFSVFLQFSDVHVTSSPIEVRRVDALYDFLQMHANAG